MCGITGFISNKKVEDSVIENMTNVLIHRGPNGFGYHYGKDFTFGHRRLSIVDLSEAGKQPMHYKSDYIITYNGEIYNHKELRNELELQGYTFESHTDTEVIMAAYDFWGTDCLNRFNGMWSFVIYNQKKDVFFISRDRFGIKPLFYYKNDGHFIFSSEIKSLLEHPVVKSKPNEKYFSQYFKNGPNEYEIETAFEGIFRFKHASFVEKTRDQILFEEMNEETFWKIKPNLTTENFSLDQAKLYAGKYYELLEDAVRLRLRADVKVGSALSGGLDSSSVVYLINKILAEQNKNELQETFSCVYKTPGTENCDESYFVDMLAKTLKVNSNQIEPQEKDVPAAIESMLKIMENPPESTCMSGWHTFKKVQEQKVVVTLDGQGADEQLGGYTPYITTYLLSLSIVDFFKEFICFLKIPKTKKILLKSTIIFSFKKVFGSQALKYCFKKITGNNIFVNLNERLANDTNTSLINLIHYSDRVSMGHSVESRMPFMDYRLVEFLATVPACYKMKNGWTKYLARLAFDGKLPQEICWRKDKMGWPIPEEHWFNGGLNKWINLKVSNFKKLDHYGIHPEEKSHYSKTELTKQIRYLNAAIIYDNFFRE